MPKPEQEPARRPSPTAAVWHRRTSSAQVAIERRRFAEEVGDGQVGPAVAVEVAAGDAHAGLVAPVGVAGHAGQVADLLESEPAQVAEQEIGRHVVGDEQVDAVVVVEVGGDDAQPPAVAVDDPGLRGHVDEPAAVVAEQVVRQRGESERQAGGVTIGESRVDGRAWDAAASQAR